MIEIGDGASSGGASGVASAVDPLEDGAGETEQLDEAADGHSLEMPDSPEPPDSPDSSELGGAGEGLAGWFAQHLADVIVEVGPAQLGIVCARLGVTQSDIAPVHLPLVERLSRLLGYLS